MGLDTRSNRLYCPVYRQLSNDSLSLCDGKATARCHQALRFILALFGAQAPYLIWQCIDERSSPVPLYPPVEFWAHNFLGLEPKICQNLTKTPKATILKFGDVSFDLRFEW